MIIIVSISLNIYITPIISDTDISNDLKKKMHNYKLVLLIMPIK